MKKVTFKEMKAILNAKSRRAKNMKPVMQRVSADMQNKVDMRFRMSKGPTGAKWKGLAPSTIANRRRGRKSGNPKILEDTGTLRSSVNSKFDGVSAITGTNLSYARYQQEYAKKGSVKKMNVYIPSFKRKTRYGTQTVKSHKRYRSKAMNTPWGDKPARPFIGFSATQKVKYNNWVKKYINQP